MILIIDTNERSTNPEIVISLQEYFTHEKVLIANLPHREHGGENVTAGDINIPLDDGCLLAIERKTPLDFLGSIASRHIFHQIEVMAQYAKYSAVIITGGFMYDRNDKVVIKGVDKKYTEGWNGTSVRAVLTLIQYSGCAVIWCPSEKFPDMVGELYNTVNKPEIRKGIKQRRIVTWPPLDERVQMLVPLVGGLQRSESLLTFAKSELLDDPDEEYGTLADAIAWGTIMNMVEHENRPAGWGPKTILNFRKRLGLQSNEYVKVEKDDSNPDKEPF